MLLLRFQLQEQLPNSNLYIKALQYTLCFPYNCTGLVLHQANVSHQANKILISSQEALDDQYQKQPCVTAE